MVSQSRLWLILRPEGVSLGILIRRILTLAGLNMSDKTEEEYEYVV
jgi:hypothetical protein